MAVVINEGLAELAGFAMGLSSGVTSLERALFDDSLGMTPTTTFASKTEITLPGYSRYSYGNLTSAVGPANGDVSYYNPAGGSMSFGASAGDTITSWGIIQQPSGLLLAGDTFAAPIVIAPAGAIFLGYDTISFGPHV